MQRARIFIKMHFRGREDLDVAMFFIQGALFALYFVIGNVPLIGAASDSCCACLIRKFERIVKRFIKGAQKRRWSHLLSLQFVENCERSVL